VALLIALFTVALYDTPARALAAAAILETGVVMASVRWFPAGDVARSVILLSGTSGAALFVGLTLRTWRSYTDALVERARRLEFERDQQAMLAVAAERARIAREMHDVVAHNVSIMVTLAEGARAVARTDPRAADETMAEVSATGRLALTDMRQLLGVLRTDGPGLDMAPQPEFTDVPSLIDGVRATGLDVELHETGQTFPVSAGSGLAIYRIIQESLTNILKHADRPSHAEVRLRFDAPFVEMTISDDGHTGAAAGEGHGLVGMRERASICGGWLTAGPRPGGGWAVTSRVRTEGSGVPG
jgi:signal transduction histidine kinase